MATHPSEPLEQRGRVHSPPLIESVRMTYTGIRNRLGRTIVTLVGIVLGIAFLMATLVTSNIRSALQDVADRHTSVQSMRAILRAEIGDLSSPEAIKKVVIVTGSSISLEAERLLADFIEHLGETSPGLQVNGPLSITEAQGDTNAFTDVSSLIAWSVGESSGWDPSLEKMKQRVVLTYDSESTFKTIAEHGARVQPLLPKATPEQLARRIDEAQKRKTRMRWLVAISLLVATIGISNALLMSVTERYREIGTMKCLGALNGFIIRLILLESGFLGVLGGIFGVIVGSLFAIFGYSGTYSFGVVLDAIDGPYLLTAGIACLVLGWIVAVFAGIYPARVAANMVPADALRTDI